MHGRRRTKEWGNCKSLMEISDEVLDLNQLLTAEYLWKYG
jgi:hypothetical protein